MEADVVFGKGGGKHAQNQTEGTRFSWQQTWKFLHRQAGGKEERRDKVNRSRREQKGKQKRDEKGSQNMEEEDE